MAGYTRQSTMADGDTITAALFNNEYNQLVNAFSNTSGHKHDGTAAEGPVIGLIGDAGLTTPLNKILIDTTNDHIEFWVDVSSSSVQQLYIADGAIIPVTDNDIDLGTSSLEFKDLYIDGTAKIDVLTVDEAATIGTTLGVTGATTLSSTLGVTGATTLSSTLDVTGATTLSSTLAVTGTSTLTGNVTTTNDLSVGGNLTVTGNATISGNLTFGDADTDSITLTADVASNITPDVDDTYDLGTATKQWRNLYIDGTAEVDTLSIDGTVVTSTAAELNILDGVTATAAEINTLDGITATVAELNILDGVTSTTTELNIVDGDTAATATTLADADRVVVNDAGVMKQVALTDFETYFEGALDTLSNVTTVGALNAGSITSGFGAIDNGSSNITTTGTVTYGSLSDGVITITAFADEDDMVSNSATLVPTQQSVKAYVDSQVTAQDLDLTTDSGTIAIDLDSETLTVAGGTGIDTSATANSVTVAIDSTVATLTGTQTLTNKTLTTPIISSISNTGTLTLPTSTDTLVGRATTDTLTNKTLTSPVLNTGVSGTAFLDDDTFATATASTLASSESIKAYVDSTVGGVSSNSIADADGDTKIQVEESADEDIIRFDTAGTERVVINATGNVGIATADPTTYGVDDADNLVIGQGGAASGLTISTFNTATGTIAFTDQTNAATGRGFIEYAHNGDSMRFGTQSSEAMRIDSSGNLGIGTASPDQLLHISAAADPAIRIENTDTTATAGQTIGKIEFEGQDASTNAAGVRALIDAQYAGVGGQGRLKFQLAQENSASLSDSLLLNYGTQQFFTSGSERMRIDSSGNVLVGKTSSDNGATVGIEMTATDKLYVTDSASSPIIANRLSSDGNVIVVQKDGTSVGLIGTQNWAIGGDTTTATSLNNLSIGAYADASSGIVLRATTASALNFEDNSSVTAGRVYYNHASDYMAFNTAQTERLRIDSSGNVGIGNTSPQRRLVVGDGSGSEIMSIYAGNTSSSALHFTDTNTTTDYQGFVTYNHVDEALRFGAAEAEVMRITSTGLGIGETSPAANLEIGGVTDPDIYLTSSNTLSTGALYFGDSGGDERGFVKYLHNGDKLAFGTAGAERMRIDASGNVGIGESNPETPLHVSLSNTGYTSVTAQTAALFERNGDCHVTIRSNAANHGSIKFADDGNSRGEIRYVHGSGTDEMRFYTAGSEKMRLNSSGQLSINDTTNPDGSNEMLQVRGTNNAQGPLVIRNASGDQSFYRMIHYYKKEETSPVAVTSIDITGSAVTHSYLSDERLKDELGSADGLNLISELNPIKFRFKDGTGTGSQGFTAQGFKQAFDNVGSFPRGVTVPDNPDEYWLLDDKVLIPNLVKAIQEQQEQIESLKSEIELLKGGN